MKTKKEIADQLIKNYADADVVSGEFYMHEKISISISINEKTVRQGIQMFLDWDDSDAKFDLQKGKKYWKIIDK